MPTYSHLTSSTSALLDVIADAVTGGSYSPLTISRTQLLAIIANDIDGTSLSHLTTSEEALWRAVVVALDGEGFSYDRYQVGMNEFLANAASNIEGGGGGNTAPHDLTYQLGGGFSEQTPPNFTITAQPLENFAQVLNTFGATDDEADPLLLSMSTPLPARVKLFDDFDEEVNDVPITGTYFVQLAPAELVADEVIPFTIRATDPGGLYVEQEFTITVTA